MLLDEFGDAAAETAGLGRRCGDAVIEHQAAGLQQRGDPVEVGCKIDVADMLEHADAGARWHRKRPPSIRHSTIQSPAANRMPPAAAAPDEPAIDNQHHPLPSTTGAGCRICAPVVTLGQINHQCCARVFRKRRRFNRVRGKIDPHANRPRLIWQQQPMWDRAQTAKNARPRFSPRSRVPCLRQRWHVYAPDPPPAPTRDPRFPSAAPAPACARPDRRYSIIMVAFQLLPSGISGL